MDAIRRDRYAYFTAFFNDFYAVEENLGSRVSDEAYRASWNVAAGASAHATLAGVRTWLTDFRRDIPKIDVPVLIGQGTHDRILPIDSCGRQLHQLMPNADYVEFDGAPHGMLWTHADDVTNALMSFLTK
jgi:non-heme chloroperoxidase